VALEHAALDQPEWRAAYTGLGFQRPQQFAGHFKIGKMYARKVRDTRVTRVITYQRAQGRRAQQGPLPAARLHGCTAALLHCTAAPLHCCTTAH
jgi:hypothetical protein